MEEIDAKFIEFNAQYKDFLMKEKEILDEAEFDEQKFREFIDNEAQEDLSQEVGKLLEFIEFEIIIDYSSMTFNSDHYQSLSPLQQEMVKLYLFSLILEKKKQVRFYKKNLETCESNDLQTRNILLCSELAEETLKLLN